MIFARYIDEHGCYAASAAEHSDGSPAPTALVYTYALASPLYPGIPSAIRDDLAALRSASAASNSSCLPPVVIAVPFTVVSQHACGRRCLRANGLFTIRYHTPAPASDAAACAACFGQDYLALRRVLRDTPSLVLSLPPISTAGPARLLSFCRQPRANAAAYLDRLACDVQFFKQNVILYSEL